MTGRVNAATDEVRSATSGAGRRLAARSASGAGAQDGPGGGRRTGRPQRRTGAPRLAQGPRSGLSDGGADAAGRGPDLRAACPSLGGRRGPREGRRDGALARRRRLAVQDWRSYGDGSPRSPPLSLTPPLWDRSCRRSGPEPERGGSPTSGRPPKRKPVVRPRLEAPGVGRAVRFADATSARIRLVSPSRSIAEQLIRGTTGGPGLSPRPRPGKPGRAGSRGGGRPETAGRAVRQPRRADPTPWRAGRPTGKPSCSVRDTSRQRARPPERPCAEARREGSGEDAVESR